MSESIRTELLDRQLANGAWSYLAGGRQPALEPTCLALLALSRDSQGTSIEPLLESQSNDGSWKAFEGDNEGSGLTGLALLTLNAFKVRDSHRQRASKWLVDACGRESRWPWKWKFRAFDTRVRFDPNKFGWPWQLATCSWVVPTAFAVLALKQTPHTPGMPMPAYRIRCGLEMLLDRVSPGGGWNAGNGVVYGRPVAPHVDATAIALLALQGEPASAVTQSSLRWLERKAASCPAPWSLAWAILALEVYDYAVDMLRQHLSDIAKPSCEPDNATLAVTALALDCAVASNPFEVGA